MYHRFLLEQMEQKRTQAKRDLAVNELERRKNRRATTLNSSSSASSDPPPPRVSRTDDPTEILRGEVEKEARRSQLRMLEKSKKKNEKTSDKVKDFMEKMATADPDEAHDQVRFALYCVCKTQTYLSSSRVSDNIR